MDGAQAVDFVSLLPATPGRWRMQLRPALRLAWKGSLLGRGPPSTSHANSQMQHRFRRSELELRGPKNDLKIGPR
eukprot:9610730-Alexandrium_andersonii.AAC.1